MTEHSQAAERRRRTNDLAVSFWRALKGPKSYPSASDLTGEAEEKGEEILDGHMFLLSLDDDPAMSMFKRGSTVLDHACGVETGGHRVAECLPDGLRDSMLGFCRTMARTGRPITVSGSFKRQEDAKTILYRTVYLPLSDDQQHVSSLLGAFSFKLAQAA